jgi:hypothetical protein
MRSQTWSEGACSRSASITRANRPRSANADVAGPRRQPMARRVGDADCSAPKSSGCIIQVAKIARSLRSGMISVHEDRCSSPRITHIVSDAAMHSRLPQRSKTAMAGVRHWSRLYLVWAVHCQAVSDRRPLFLTFLSVSLFECTAARTQSLLGRL